MFLEEIACQVNGQLDSKYSCNNVDGPVLGLMDQCNRVCIVEDWKDGCMISSDSATASGNTEEEARANLAEKLRGKIIKYRYPMHGTTYESFLRIPPTLVGDKSLEFGLCKLQPHERRDYVEHVLGSIGNQADGFR